MLIEIPDPGVILSVIVAFLVGVGGLYLYYKIRPFVKIQDVGDSAAVERLEYYEKQLIDMKIRLDALELQDDGPKEEPDVQLREFLSRLVKDVSSMQVGREQNGLQAGAAPQKPPVVPEFEHSNAVDYVLHLITHKDMTSRDIQVTLKRSREHTSRLMKRLFEDGYVQRTPTKPYKYSITQKGREKISRAETPNAVLA